MDRLRELQTLVAIVDMGGLAAAARRLGRSPPSISRDLADLEARIGASLVERSTRSCRPTPAGIRLADDARPLLSGYEEAIGQAAGEATAPRGSVRITAPITFGGSFVAPLVTAFLDIYPQITIDLQLNDRIVDLAEEDFDLAVRIGRLADSSMIARTVGELRRVFVASPAYLDARGTPERPADLADHEIIQHTSRGAATPLTFAGEGRRTITVSARARFTVNQPEAALAAAREGRGIVGVLSHQVDSDLRAGTLVRILKEFEPAALPISLVWPPSRRSWRRVRLLVDHLANGLSALDVTQGVPGQP
jgi:DNA-binding transcriptional LysR family regulator